MSLPTTKPPPTAQLSIRSFFQAKQQPKYAPPPSSTPPSQATSSVNASPQPLVADQSAPSPSPPTNLPAPTTTAPLPPPPTNLPPEASVRLIHPDDIAALRRINSLLLQVSYPDNFYQKATDPRGPSGRFSRVITWTHEGEEPKVVGGIVSHLEPAILDMSSAGSEQVPQNLYIRSLCLLAPYRSLGLVNAALEHVVATAMADTSLDVKTVSAHVWTENEEGLHWYEARGFQKQEPPVKGYYLKLRPDSAWLVHRELKANVRGSLPKSTAMTTATRAVPLSTTAAVVNLSTISPPPAASISGPPSSKSTPPLPPPTSAAGSRPQPITGQSYQNQRPDMEWNDLPADMAPPIAPSLRRPGSESASATSSRSSSSAPRKKKDRSYPAAAFGHGK